VGVTPQEDLEEAMVFLAGKVSNNSALAQHMGGSSIENVLSALERHGVKCVEVRSHMCVYSMFSVEPCRWHVHSKK